MLRTRGVGLGDRFSGTSDIYGLMFYLIFTLLIRVYSLECI